MRSGWNDLRVYLLNQSNIAGTGGSEFSNWSEIMKTTKTVFDVIFFKAASKEVGFAADHAVVMKSGTTVNEPHWGRITGSVLTLWFKLTQSAPKPWQQSKISPALSVCEDTHTHALVSIPQCPCLWGWIVSLITSFKNPKLHPKLESEHLPSVAV